MNFLAGAKRTAPQVGWSQEEADALAQSLIPRLVEYNLGKIQSQISQKIIFSPYHFFPFINLATEAIS